MDAFFDRMGDGDPVAVTQFLAGAFVMFISWYLLPEILEEFEPFRNSEGLQKYARKLVTLAISIPLVYLAALSIGLLARW